MEHGVWSMDPVGMRRLGISNLFSQLACQLTSNQRLPLYGTCVPVCNVLLMVLVSGRHITTIRPRSSSSTDGWADARRSRSENENELEEYTHTKYKNTLDNPSAEPGGPSSGRPWR